VIISLPIPHQVPEKKQEKDILEYFLSTAPAVLLMLKQLLVQRLAMQPSLACCPLGSQQQWPKDTASPTPSFN
jgi:hypothetical protein